MDPIHILLLVIAGLVVAAAWVYAIAFAVVLFTGRKVIAKVTDRLDDVLEPWEDEHLSAFEVARRRDMRL